MSEKSAANSLALVGAGILGFAGVGAAAMSAHAGDDPRLASAVALVCLTHAPALLALPGPRAPRASVDQGRSSSGHVENLIK